MVLRADPYSIIVGDTDDVLTLLTYAVYEKRVHYRLRKLKPGNEESVDAIYWARHVWLANLDSCKAEATAMLAAYEQQKYKFVSSWWSGVLQSLTAIAIAAVLSLPVVLWIFM